MFLERGFLVPWLVNLITAINFPHWEMTKNSLVTCLNYHLTVEFEAVYPILVKLPV